MRSFEQYDEICKYFTEGKQRDTNKNEVQKHLRLDDLGVGGYLNDKYALCIDFRINKNTLHGTGRKVGSERGGIHCKSRRKLNWLEHLMLTYT